MFNQASAICCSINPATSRLWPRLRRHLGDPLPRLLAVPPVVDPVPAVREQDEFRVTNSTAADAITHHRPISLPDRDQVAEQVFPGFLYDEEPECWIEFDTGMIRIGPGCYRQPARRLH